ncbi:MAG: polymorphic outer membrane protein, partial [Chloroflexi bacterium OLB14]
MKYLKRALFVLICTALLLTSIGTTPAHAAGLCYVNDDAGGSDNGTSWTDAYTDLQDAIADSCTEIWVAQGTYKPHTSTRTVSFNLESGTAIYGGFAGTETLLSERDYKTNVTILSGDLNGDDSGFTNNSENTYNVVKSSGVNNTAILDGFTITGGNANGVGFPNNIGGGMFNGSSSSPTLANLIIQGNSASSGGGGMTNDSSSPTLTNIIFSGNQTVTLGASGGGLYNRNNSSPTLTNVTLKNNTSTTGGGIYNDTSSPTLANVTFSGNTAPSGDGGGMYNYASSPTLTNVTFSGNSATNTGGIHNTSTSDITLKNVIIANNTNGDCYLNSSTVNAASSNNLIESTGSSACGLTNGVNGNIIGADPDLLPLADNGGATETFALQLSSSALNAGTNTGCPSTDQRGISRPQNGLCDIGAYESNAQPGPTFVVNTNEDSNDGFCDNFVAGVSDCTLREAITYTNTIAGTDTITFAANYTITLSSELPNVLDTLIINGNGASNTIIQANANPNTANYRIIAVIGNLTLNNVTLRHGVCNGFCSMGDIGGGILVQSGGTLALNNSVISANTANDGGGGLYSINGVVTITNTTFTSNSTSGLGGGAAITNQGTMTISNSTITNNTSSNGSAGAGAIRNIAGIGTLNIYNSTIAGNISNGANSGANITQESGTLNLHNTILANSSGTNLGDCRQIGGTITATNTLIESSGVGAC